MSKNNKKRQGLQSLATLVAVEPEAEVVAALTEELLSQPVFAVLEEIKELDSEIQLLEPMTRDLEGIRSQAGLLGQRFHQWKSNLKSRLYASTGITDERARQGSNLGKYIEQLVEKGVKQSSTASRMQEELRHLVAQAEEKQRVALHVQELRSAKESLETEAQSLLGSL